MNKNKSYQRRKFYSVLSIILGIIGGILYIIGQFYLENYITTRLALSLMLGFLTFGIGMHITNIRSKKDPDLRKKLSEEHDERNVYNRTVAAEISFWVIFIYMIVMLLFINVINISLSTFIIITIMIMSLLYILITFIRYKFY